jgi:hypothetical protein
MRQTTFEGQPKLDTPKLRSVDRRSQQAEAEMSVAFSRDTDAFCLSEVLVNFTHFVAKSDDARHKANLMPLATRFMKLV